LPNLGVDRKTVLKQRNGLRRWLTACNQFWVGSKVIFCEKVTELSGSKKNGRN
jgi:hypothetical protein